jgi:hypothetical protein
MLWIALACTAPKTGDTHPTDDTATVDDTGQTTVDDTGTAPHQLTDGFERELTAHGGCSDTWMQAWDPDGIAGLELHRAGLLQRAIVAGETVEETLTVGVDDVTLFVELADPVAVNYCTDVIDERTVYDHYDAASGTVALTMDPPASEFGPGVLDVRLTDVVFQDASGDADTVETFEVLDVDIIQNWGA